MVTHNPLHRSGQAALPHPALALGGDGKPHEGIGVADSGEWEPARGVFREAAPRHSALLTSALERKHPVLTISRTPPAACSIAGTRWMARRKFETTAQLAVAC